MSFRGQLIKLGFHMEGPSLALWQDAARFAIGGNLVAGVNLSIGSDSYKIAMTDADDRALQIYTTQSVTSGTSMTAEINHTQTGASATIIEALRVNIDSEVQTGSWANAIVGRINYGTAGDAGGGLAAAVCGEMNLPAKSMTGTGGNYYCFDAEMNVPAGCTLQDSTTRFAAFIKVGAWGSGNFNDYGYFLHVDGLTAAADDLLSLTSHTLKVNLEGNERFALMGSQLQDGLGLGVTGTPMVLTATGDRAVAIFTTSSVASADVTAFQLKSVTTGSSGNSIVADFWGYHDTATKGDNCTVGMFYSEWTNAARGPTGMCSAVTGKMLVPTTCTGGFWTYYGKINFNANPGLSAYAGNSVGWFMLSIGGVASGTDDFDDYGMFMDVHNLTAGATHLLSAGSHTLRCAIDVTTTRYLVLSTAENCLTLGDCTIGVDLSGAMTDGVLIDGSVVVDGIHIDSNCTGAALHITGETCARAILIGSMTNTEMMTLTQTNNYPVGVFARVLTGSQDPQSDLRGLRVRTRVDASCVHGAAGTDKWGYGIWGIEGQLNIYGGSTNLAGWMNAGVWAMVETDGVASVTLDEAGASIAALHAHMDLALNTVIDTDAYAIGVSVLSNSTSTNLGNNYYGIRIYKESGKISWATGLVIESSTVGLSIAAGSISTTGISVTGAMSGATAKAIRSAVSVTAANHGDGYACNEFDYTLTTSVAGHTACLSAWCNIYSGVTLASTGYLTPLSLGIYEDAGASPNNARMVCAARIIGDIGDTTGWKTLSVFSINITQDITALWECTSFHTNTGWYVGTGESGAPSGYVAFMCDAEGNVKYIRLYDTKES